jgi:heme-degrading monooxygenase HmoA
MANGGSNWTLTRRAAVSFIVVTRLRLRDPEYRDEFVGSAFTVVDQANNSVGILAAEVLADANETYWTRTAWTDRDAMSRFVTSEPHLATMGHLSEWCDEATFIDWEQSEPDLPNWQEAFRRLVTDGQVASLVHPSEYHETRAFPPPVES